MRWHVGWPANGSGRPNPIPLVLEATVDASELIYWGNDRAEEEVIVRRRPFLRIDPYSGDWAGVAQRVEDARKEANKARLAAYSLFEFLDGIFAWSISGR